MTDELPGMTAADFLARMDAVDEVCWRKLLCSRQKATERGYIADPRRPEEAHPELGELYRYTATGCRRVERCGRAA